VGKKADDMHIGFKLASVHGGGMETQFSTLATASNCRAHSYRRASEINGYHALAC